MVDINFGQPVERYTGFADTYVYSDGFGVPKGRAMADGTGPVILTHIRGWISGNGASRSVRFRLSDKCYTDYFTVAAGSDANDTGWRAFTNGSTGVRNSGTYRLVFDLSGTSYFARGGSGSVVSADGYVWSDGELSGMLRYSEGPTAPRNLVVNPAVSTAGAINLDWDAPTSDGGDSLNGYRVFGRVEGGAWSERDTGTGTSYTWTGLSASKRYQFKVAARNNVTEAAGTESVHTSISGYVSPPDEPTPPVGLVANPSPSVSGQINLSWSAPQDTNGTITGYTIYRNGTLLKRINGTGTSTTDGGLAVGSSHYYAVYAHNTFSDNIGTMSGVSNTSTATAPGVPSAPRSLTATPSATVGGRISLAWQAPSTTAGGITGYNIYRGGVSVAQVDGSTLSANIDGHTVGTSYSFDVRARNQFADANGTVSAQSNTATATAPGLPTAPQNLTATPATNEFGRINLSWSAPANTAGGIQFYNVYRNGTSIGSTNGATTYAATGLTHHASHSFTIRARNQFALDNNTTGPDSNTSSAVAPGPPSAPQNLTAIPHATIAGRVDLDWDAPATTGGTITRYSVYYSTGAHIADTTGTVTAYSVTGLAPGSGYGFYVRAWNAVADAAGTPSANSNTASTQAAGDPTPPASLTVTQSAAVAGRLIVSWPAVSGSTGYSVFKDSPAGAPLVIVKSNQYIADDLALNTTHTYYVRARNAVTDSAGTTGGDPVGPASGTPSSTTVQAVNNYSATDATNVLLSGTYAVSAVSANTLSFARTMANIGTLAVPSGSITNTTNQALNGQVTITTPTTNTFGFTKTIHNIPAGTSVSNGTAFNDTNLTFNGPHQLTGADGTTGTIQWTDSQGNVGPVASSGTITNTSNAVYNVADTAITAVTETTFSYARTGKSDQALSSASGTVYNITNRDFYNGTYPVLETSTYDTFTYRPDTGDTTTDLPSQPIGLPRGEASRVQSPAELEILYRSGWAG